MSINNPFHGSPFANDFICESITESPDCRAIDVRTHATFEAAARDIFNGFPTRNCSRFVR